MLQVRHVDPQPRVKFEAFGVPVSVTVPSAELLARIEAVLPPGSQPCDAVPEENEFQLASRDGVSYRVQSLNRSLSGSSDLDVALEILESELRSFVAAKAPDHVFVHAGVVVQGGSAIVIPGPTFSGKTSLVAALVGAGALYYSDEFAVLDSDGRVHPYVKPLSIRVDGMSQVDHDVAALGGVSGQGPTRAGVLLMCRYVPGARWNPRQLSAGEAVLAMLSNTVPAQERPDQALEVVTKALQDAVAFEGERGEATEVVEQVLGALPAH